MNAEREDLEFLYDKLTKHPLFRIDGEAQERFDALYQTVAQESDDLIDKMTALTSSFRDGHTNIELPYTPQDRCLNIPCRWEQDRLLLAQEYEGVESGAEILSIENRTVRELIGLMSGRIPHENEYLVRSRMIHYPYKNYHLFSERNLKALFGERESFEISFSIDGRESRKRYPLQSYNSFLDFRDDNDFISFEIEGRTAVLHLDACVYNDTYKSVLRELAGRCEQEKIETLILDLSKNMGGSSSCIDEFIRYLPADEFRRYEMIDYSQEPVKIVTRRMEIVKNRRYEVSLPPKLYCRVSHDTFSSARTFAVTLKDNGFAQIIGAPTGGKPSSFGMPQRYKTPNHGISFRVSRCLFLRPDASRDEETALFPEE